MPISKTCEWCGNAFNVRPAKGKQRFCSAPCQRAMRESCHAEKACENCGTVFVITRKREMSRRFCNRACQTQHESVHGRPAAQVQATTFNCRECGNEFSYKPAYLTEYHKKFGKDPMYCSIQCSAAGRKKDTELRHKIECVQCGKPLPTRNSSGHVRDHGRLCSTECRSLYRRLSYQRKHAGRTNTRRIAKNGYVRLVISGVDGGESRDVFEHRYVMEKSLGRTLHPEETVHHINGDRQDNRLENLELFSSRHGPGQRVTDKVAFAIEILGLYPEFARSAGYELVSVQDD